MEDNNIKIGARILSDKDLKILLPTYEDINKNIEQMRKMAEDVRERKKGKEFQGEIEYFKQHNNVISILGERGSGKSSVLLSKKYELENNKNNKDIVLPMLVPQDLEGGKDILGWILGYFEENLKNDSEIFDKTKKQTKEDLKEKLKQICKAYFTKRDEYLETLKKIESTTEYVEKNLQSLKSTLSIPKLFNDFIDVLTKELKDGSNKEENLIFIFFDDVDLDGHRCLNVFDIILKYLSHPNIVIFIGGNYNNFKETLTIKYLKDDGLLDKDLMDKSLDIGESFLKERELLAYDYLKKILSPALRYELKKFTVKEKKNFTYDSNKKNLETLINNKNNKLNIAEEYKEFIYDLLDDKPRGLINVYYYLKNRNVEKIEDLFYIMIISNPDLEFLKDYKLEFENRNYEKIIELLKTDNVKKFVSLLKILIILINVKNDEKQKIDRLKIYKKLYDIYLDKYDIEGLFISPENDLKLEYNTKVFLEILKILNKLDDLQIEDKYRIYFNSLNKIYGNNIKNIFEKIYVEDFNFIRNLKEKLDGFINKDGEVEKKLNKILRNLYLIPNIKNYKLNNNNLLLKLENINVEFLIENYEYSNRTLVEIEEIMLNKFIRNFKMLLKKFYRDNLKIKNISYIRKVLEILKIEELVNMIDSLANEDHRITYETTLQKWNDKVLKKVFRMKKIDNFIHERRLDNRWLDNIIFDELNIEEKEYEGYNLYIEKLLDENEKRYSFNKENEETFERFHAILSQKIKNKRELIIKNLKNNKIEEKINNFNLISNELAKSFRENSIEKEVLNYIDFLKILKEIKKIETSIDEVRLENIIDLHIKRKVENFKLKEKIEIIRELDKIEAEYKNYNILYKVNRNLEEIKELESIRNDEYINLQMLDRGFLIINNLDESSENILRKLPRIKVGKNELNRLEIDGKIYKNLLRIKLEEEVRNDNDNGDKEYNDIHEILCEVMTGVNK